MTNRITDGFDWFPSGQNTATRQMLFAANSWYAYGNQLNDPCDVVTGAFNFGKAFLYDKTVGSFSPLTNGYVVPIGVDTTEGFLGFHYFRYDDSFFGQPGMVCFFDAVNNGCHFSVCFEDYGIIKVWRGFRPNGSTPSTTDLLGTSAVGSYQDNEQFHVEIYGKVHDTDGEVEVRINTVQKVSIVASNTKGSIADTADSIWIGACQSAVSGSHATHYWLDNLFFNDTAGSINNDWIGNVRVKTQFMIANGPHIDFNIGGTSPAASNWQSVQNTLLNDTKFVYSGTIGDYDLYDPDPILNAPLVHCLQIRGALWQDDATQRIAKYLVQIAGVNYDAPTDFYTNQTPTFYKDRLETNPATSAGWTGTDVNGLYAGVKVEG